MGFKEFAKRRSLRTRDDKRTKAAELTLRQSIYPICLVTVLFFLWGFSYGLLDTLNKHFQNVLDVTKSRSAGLQAAYFGAYPLASLGHANWILRHYGYRATFIWGLFLYCVGALVAWPCIEAHSFTGFCIAIFIIGNGLGSLETAANPYITVCGPPRYSEMRINLSQAFNGIGTIVAPLVGSVAFFGLDDETKAIANVKWVYIAIAAFVLLLAVLFFLSDIPEITDADMAHQATETHAGTGDQPFRKQYRLFHAAFAQFCYVGAQVAIASFFINYVDTVRPGIGDVASSRLFAGAQGGFALGRFLGVALMKFIKPRLVFFAFLTACVIFIIPAIATGDNAGIAMLYVVLFFESICFPTIVALGMRGLGRHSKRGSGFIVGGVLGGAVVPPLTGVVADKLDTRLAMIIPLIFFVLASSYSFAVNFVPAYRDNADAFTNTKVGLTDANASPAMEKGEGGITEQSHHESKHLQ